MCLLGLSTSFEGREIPHSILYLGDFVNTDMGDLCLHYTLNMCVQVCHDRRLDEVEWMVFVVKVVQGSVMTSWNTLGAHSWPEPHHPVRTYHISLDRLWNYHFRFPLYENITTCLSSWTTVSEDDGEKPSCAHVCISSGTQSVSLQEIMYFSTG